MFFSLCSRLTPKIWHFTSTMLYTIYYIYTTYVVYDAILSLDGSFCRIFNIKLRPVNTQQAKERSGLETCEAPTGIDCKRANSKVHCDAEHPIEAPLISFLSSVLLVTLPTGLHQHIDVLDSRVSVKDMVPISLLAAPLFDVISMLLIKHTLRPGYMNRKNRKFRTDKLDK